MTITSKRYSTKITPVDVESIKKELSDSLNKITEEYNRLKEERESQYGKIAKADYCNKSYPKYNLSQCLDNITHEVENNPNCDAQAKYAWRDLRHELYRGNEDWSNFTSDGSSRCSHFSGYNIGYRNSFKLVYTDEWIEEFEKIMRYLEIDEATMDKWAKDIIKFQKEACEKLPRLGKYDEEIYGLRQAQKNIEKALEALNMI